MTRRTQNSEESIDSQKGAGQPVQLQAVSVEHHRWRIARRPVVARAQQFRRRAGSAVSSTPAACCRTQSNASAEILEPQSPHLATILDLYGALYQAATETP